MLPQYAINEVVWRKNPWNGGKGTFTENMLYEPTFMAYELRLLWHTNPDFYTIQAVFVGGGGGLLYIYIYCFGAHSFGRTWVYSVKSFFSHAVESLTPEKQLFWGACTHDPEEQTSKIVKSPKHILEGKNFWHSDLEDFMRAKVQNWISLIFRGCDWNRYIQESQGPLGPKSPKISPKGLPGPSVKKVSRKYQRTRKRVKNQCSWTFSTLFWHSGRKSEPNSEERGVNTNPSKALWPKFLHLQTSFVTISWWNLLQEVKFPPKIVLETCLGGGGVPCFCNVFLDEFFSAPLRSCVVLPWWVAKSQGDKHVECKLSAGWWDASFSREWGGRQVTVISMRTTPQNFEVILNFVPSHLNLRVGGTFSRNYAWNWLFPKNRRLSLLIYLCQRVQGDESASPCRPRKLWPMDLSILPRFLIAQGLSFRGSWHVMFLLGHFRPKKNCPQTCSQRLCPPPRPASSSDTPPSL